MKTSHYDAAKAIIAFLIVLLAFGIFLLFYMNSDAIIQSNRFYLFISLATIAMGLLLGLLYLVNNQPHLQKPRVTKSVAKSHKKKIKKKSRSR